MGFWRSNGGEARSFRVSMGGSSLGGVRRLSDVRKRPGGLSCCLVLFCRWKWLMVSECLSQLASKYRQVDYLDTNPPYCCLWWGPAAHQMPGPSVALHDVFFRSSIILRLAANHFEICKIRLPLTINAVGNRPGRNRKKEIQFIIT